MCTFSRLRRTNKFCSFLNISSGHYQPTATILTDKPYVSPYPILGPFRASTWMPFLKYDSVTDVKWLYQNHSLLMIAIAQNSVDFLSQHVRSLTRSLRKILCITGSIVNTSRRRNQNICKIPFHTSSQGSR